MQKVLIIIIDMMTMVADLFTLRHLLTLFFRHHTSSLGLSFHSGCVCLLYGGAAHASVSLDQVVLTTSFLLQLQHLLIAFLCTHIKLH